MKETESLQEEKWEGLRCSEEAVVTQGKIHTWCGGDPSRSIWYQQRKTPLENTDEEHEEGFSGA